jgi:dTDP-4-dehydrorhamnose 3,5-epimerase-like enzyme
MEIQATGLKDCLIIKPWGFDDSRWYFFESFNQKTFEEKTGLSRKFVQHNQSFSSYDQPNIDWLIPATKEAVLNKDLILNTFSALA